MDLKIILLLIKPFFLFYPVYGCVLCEQLAFHFFLPCCCLLLLFSFSLTLFLCTTTHNLFTCCYIRKFIIYSSFGFRHIYSNVFANKSHDSIPFYFSAHGTKHGTVSFPPCFMLQICLNKCQTDYGELWLIFGIFFKKTPRNVLHCQIKFIFARLTIENINKIFVYYNSDQMHKRMLNWSIISSILRL